MPAKQQGPVLVIGGTGQLGEALLRLLGLAGRSVEAPPRERLDVTRLDSLQTTIESCRPAVLINASGYTDVGAAERPEERPRVDLLNRDAPARMAEVAARLGVPYVHVSTDYVFDGMKGRPYTESDAVSPLQVYGESKLAGERAVTEGYPDALIVRTSTLFGHGRSLERPHYVEAILRQGRSKEMISVVRPPVSSPTYAPDLAAGILELLQVGATGIVHLSNDGACSRLELATAALRVAGLTHVRIEEREAPSAGLERPEYSVLSVDRFAELTGKRPRHWEQALAAYVEAGS